MRKERKKVANLIQVLTNSVIVFVFFQYVSQPCTAESDNIIASSVVTSVSVILHGEGRSNKEVIDMMTTAPPPPIVSDFEPSYASSSTTETPTAAVTTEPSTASTVKVPFPVYIHAQPVRNSEDESVIAEDPTEAPTATSPPASIVELDSVAQTTTTSAPQPPPPAPVNLPPPGTFSLIKASRRADDDGIRVIDALKDIVRQAQQQHALHDAPVPSPITLTLTDNNLITKGYGLPPVAKDPMPVQEEPAHAQPHKTMPGTGLNGDDDDEMEFNVNAGSLDPGAATTDVIDDFAKVVVVVQPEDNSEAENDTAPSAEVTDAMHKISGAILSSDDILQKPVEHIVNDVLGSLNAARNGTQPSPTSTTTTSTTPVPTTSSTTTTPAPTTTTRRTTTTSTTTTTTTTTTPRPTTTTATTTTTTRPTTARTAPPTTSTTTTTQRPTLPPRTTSNRPSTTTTLPWRTTTTTRRTTTLPPRTVSTTTQRTTLPPFFQRIPPRITQKIATTTTTRPPTTRTTTTTARPTTRVATTLRPRPPQTTESFAYGSIFNTGLDVKTQQSLTTIVKKDKPVMYSTEPESDVPPPPYQGAPPTTKAPMTSTTEKLMSALEIMIKQSEQLGRPPNPLIQIVNSDVFDSETSDGVPQTTDYRIPGIPVDEVVEQSTSSELNENDDSSDTSTDPDQEDNDPIEDSGDTEVEFTTLKPYVPPPSKKPMNSLNEKKKENETSSSKRPNEFYDDEIFGYDPYQTFHHGVYVPLVEIQPLEDQRRDESSEEEVYVPPTTSKPKKKRPRPNQPASNVRPFVKQGKPSRTRPRPSSSASNKNVKKPMPTLPDYLHRPRPSHLQYQHGAADDTDPVTGLLNPNYMHPGESFGPETQTFAPDRLLAIPPQALPQNVRKNLTDHHDHHYQHQHGLVVPGHGHHGNGHSHGDSQHGDSNSSSGGPLPTAHVPNQASNHLQTDNQPVVAEKRPDFGPAPPGNPGLEATLTNVDPEMRSFVDINNRIALRLFSSLTNPVSKSSTSYGNMVVSPFTITSSLSMLFLGARGNTAHQLDGLLRLDDMLTFNPHMMYHNITQAFLTQPNTAAAMIRLLIADKAKGGILDFYRTRVQHFYDARVEQADYKFAGHLAQSIINQMIRAQIQRHSYELLNYSLPLSGPMSLLTATFFDGQFAGVRDAKVDGMNFIHLAALGRRLFPVPALAIKGKFRAAYDNDLDATAVEIPYTSRDLSLIVMMPGKPGEFSIGGVASLKSKLTLESWTQLMRGFYPRDSFKVVLPRFRHQTAVNLTYTLKRFGLTDLFMSEQAQFKGINGLVDLFVDENMMHFTEFGTWEKLSDTMRENNMQNNKNLDLIRVLRPYVKDQYGQYAEPLSVNDWISMSRQPAHQNEQRSRGPQPQPMDIRLALRLAHAEEKMKRRQSTNGARSNTNPRLEPLRPFMRPKGKRSKSSRSNSSRRHNRRNEREERQNNVFARQEPTTGAEIEERVLKFERPFVYVLRHNPTGMILMTGQYTEPVTEVLE